ncbi:class I SAM-dependent methyltransferase [Patescibacteria group bacterium]|nr:class I SAM-dependent methyltransferase [Patescibacteria group bacterium]
MNKNQKNKLNKILSKVGDLNFKRRIIAMLDYLDIQDGEVILDMGCGEGFYSMIFDQLHNCKVIAVDYDKAILAMAGGWLENSEKVSFEEGDICNLRFDDNYFDKILCTEVIEHIEDDTKATKELYRVLKPGGILAVTVPNSNYPLVWDPFNKIREWLGFGHFDPLNGFWGGIWAHDHKRLYSPNSLKTLLQKAGFEVSNLGVLTHYGIPFNHLVLYIGKQFYTSFPVPDSIKNSMEKFKWDARDDCVIEKISIFSLLLNFGLKIMKWADHFNDRNFSLDTSSMAVMALAKKKNK